MPPEVIRGLSAPRDPLHQRIGERDVWYHATSPQNVPEILRTGEIRPLGMAEQAKETLLKQGSPVGVSVSRTPRIASKADKAVTFAIDREKMPPSRPFVEPKYSKTEPNEVYFPDTGKTFAGGPNRPNPRFEFEQRTYNQSIPLSAVREALIDKSALQPQVREALTAGPQRYIWDDPIAELKAAGIPVRVVPSGRALHSERAARAKPFYKRRSAGATE